MFAERFRVRRNWLRGRYTVRTFEGHSQGLSVSVYCSLWSPLH